MGLTNTQASALGKACLLNPSYVSRLRNGKRPLPKNPVFIQDMSHYLSSHVKESYQKIALCQVMGIPSWPEDSQQAAALLESWLTCDEGNAPDLAPVLASFAGIQTSRPMPSAEPHALPQPKNYYYGPTGKQQAVLQFFDLILKEKEPQTLLLYSNEDFSWLGEDPVFSAQWAKGFTQVLMRGNRVKMIHAIGRNMNEMLQGVAHWIPIYATGMIEPYYYPKLRDSISQRTLFIAPNTAAIVSSSFNRKTDGMLNELITDKEAVAAISLEYQNYFELCNPLMHIMTMQKQEELWTVYNTLLDTDGESVCLSDMPTLVTMPQWVAEAMQNRAPESRIYAEWQAASLFLSKLSENTAYTELLPSFSPDSVQVPLPRADLLGAPGLYYTDEEWKAHVESSLHFEKEHPWYRQFPYPDAPKNIFLFGKDSRGFMVFKTNAPGVAFAISEANMVNSFWSYLARNLP